MLENFMFKNSKNNNLEKKFFLHNIQLSQNSINCKTFAYYLSNTEELFKYFYLSIIKNVVPNFYAHALH